MCVRLVVLKQKIHTPARGLGEASADKSLSHESLIQCHEPTHEAECRGQASLIPGLDCTVSFLPFQFLDPPKLLSKV